jgi:hypothetical protein
MYKTEAELLKIQVELIFNSIKDSGLDLNLVYTTLIIANEKLNEGVN